MSVWYWICFVVEIVGVLAGLFTILAYIVPFESAAEVCARLVSWLFWPLVIGFFALIVGLIVVCLQGGVY